MSILSQQKQSVNTDFPNLRPSLDLDFTQEVLDSRITFTRGSTATRVNRNRLIETIDANQPRFDYDPVTGECKGLLIEESRQNLLTYSENFSQGVWTKHNSSINSNVITAPDNTSNATKLIENTSNVQHMVYRNLTSAVNTTYTFSFFAKSAERQYVLASFSGGGLSSDCVVGVSLIDGSVTTTSNSPENTSVTKLPNGWYRITLTKTTPSASAFQPRILISRTGSSSQTYQGDGTSGIYIWGAQLEAGAFPTSYIPTTTSSVTRSADLASMTGTNFSSWFNQTEGTLYADLNNITTRSSLSYDAFVSLAGTDVNRNVMRIYTQTASGGGGQNKFLGAVAYSPDGSYVFNSFDSNVGGPDRIGKAILAYKKDNFAFTVNGLTPTKDISGDIPTCNQLLIYGASRFQLAPSGYIKRLTYYPRSLKPNQLQLLTQ